MSAQQEEYVCIGVCTPEPVSGACLGCGRPLLPSSPAVSPVIPSTDVVGSEGVVTPTPVPNPPVA